MWPIQTQDKLFHDGNGTTELGTVVTAEWLNDVQQALLAVLAAAGIAPAKGRQNLLRDAIQRMISARTPAGTATTPGVLKVINGLTSTDASAALAAAQGKVLAEQSMRCLVSGTSPDDPDTTTKSFILTTHANKPAGSGQYCYIATWFYGNFNSSRWQLAVDYTAGAAAPQMWVRSAYSTPQRWTTWQRIDGADWTEVRNRPGAIKAYAADAVNQTDLAAAINNLVNGAPGALDTLKELATALGNDPNFATTITNQLAQTVKLTGAQNVAGQKTFTDTVVLAAARSLWNGWRVGIKIPNSGSAIVNSAETAGLGVHENGNIYFIDFAANKYLGTLDRKGILTCTDVYGDGHRLGLKANQSDLVAGLAGKANKATTLAGYGITDAASKTELAAVSTTAAQAAPAGEIAYFASAAAPAGWLKANGAAVSRTTYAALFAAIGTRYGTGNGSSTFNLPDLRGEFVRGFDDGRGVDAGRALGSAQADDFKAHGHNWYVTEEGGADEASADVDFRNGNGKYWPKQTSATGGAETRPRNIALLACIKI